MKWKVIAVLALLTASFQNCSMSGPATGGSQSKGIAQNNGEGYSGKITYASETCGDGSVRTKIVIEDLKKAYLTREECQDIAPREIPFVSVDILPHNLQNLGYGGRAFDREHALSGVNTLFCRGRSAGLNGENNAVDAVIRKDGGKYFGHVILGVYDADWKLKQTKDMGEIPVDLDGTTVPGHRLFHAGLGRDDIFTLDVNDAAMTARLTYASAPSTPPSGSPPSGDFHVAGGLVCYEQ